MSIPDKLYSEKLSCFQDSIKVLYLIDDDFKSICDDYCYTKINAEKFKEKIRHDFQIKIEYENLAKELEDDIVQYIAKNMENLPP